MWNRSQETGGRGQRSGRGGGHGLVGGPNEAGPAEECPAHFCDIRTDNGPGGRGGEDSGRTLVTAGGEDCLLLRRVGCLAAAHALAAAHRAVAYSALADASRGR